MRKQFLLFCVLLTLLCLTGCGGSSETASSPEEPPVYSPLRVLVPEAPGTEVIGNEPLLLDISNKTQGYLTALSSTADSRVNVQLTDPAGIKYSYFVAPMESAVIPFSGGSGKYLVVCYQQIAGEQYAALFSQELDIHLDSEFLPYLYPNQYVDFRPENEACKKALSMLPDDTEDTAALEAIYNYVVENVTYDEEKAAGIEAGYLPDIDETLATGKGICFDYAALIACMLRSRDIPCKLQIGYAGSIRHAWIDVFIRSRGWVNNAIEFDGESWTRLDPTFDSSAGEAEKEEIRNFIGDGTNYAVQFTR